MRSMRNSSIGIHHTGGLAPLGFRASMLSACKKNPRERHDAWQLGRLPPLSEAAATVRSRGPTGRASIRAADDVLETGCLSEEILACFEEALGDQLPEMGSDAAAGREANAEGAEAARRLEAAAEQKPA